MVNRTLCEALEEMRMCCKTGNYSYLPGLIEEAQSMGNRMEGKLQDVHELEYIHKNIKKAERKLKDVKEKGKDCPSD